MSEALVSRRANLFADLLIVFGVSLTVFEGVRIAHQARHWWAVAGCLLGAGLNGAAIALRWVRMNLLAPKGAR